MADDFLYANRILDGQLGGNSTVEAFRYVTLMQCAVIDNCSNDLLVALDIRLDDCCDERVYLWLRVQPQLLVYW